MNVPAVRKATDVIADDLLTLANLIFDDDSISSNRKINENTLKNSFLRDDLYATVSENFGDDPVITAFFNHYVVFLEWTRPPMYGKRPPISALKDWAERKGVPTDAVTLNKIATAIWRDGHQGRPILATLDREAEAMFNSEWADGLYEAITSQLDEFFNTQ